MAAKTGDAEYRDKTTRSQPCFQFFSVIGCWLIQTAGLAETRIAQPSLGVAARSWLPWPVTFGFDNHGPTEKCSDHD